MKTKIFISLLLIFFSFNSYSQSQILAKEYAFEAAKKLMKKISPNTGNNPTSEIVDIEYDYDNNRYIIEMKATWYAGTCLLCDEELFVVKGILKVNKNGLSPNFKQTYTNSAVDNAWTDNDVENVLVGVYALAEIASESEPNSKSEIRIENHENKTLNFSYSLNGGYSFTSTSIDGGNTKIINCDYGDKVVIKIKTSKGDYSVESEYTLISPDCGKLGYNSSKGKWVLYDCD